MLDSILFLLINMAIFLTIAWAVKQDDLSKRSDSTETDVVN
jgi:hypothetical protein